MKTLKTRTRQILENCRRHNLTIAKKKLEAGTSITFAGYLLSEKGIEADPDKVKALASFPQPTSLTELRSFLGLANQLGNFVRDLATTSEPLRSLLRKDTLYKWTEDIEHAFNATKKLLTSPNVVSFFDPALPTSLLSDASNLHGIGYALIQYDTSSQMRLVQCGSRSLSDAETRYAPIELECLCLLYTSPSPRDKRQSRMPSSA